MQGIINKPGHPLQGKTVTLGGSSNHFISATKKLRVQSVRFGNQWSTVPKDCIEPI